MRIHFYFTLKLAHISLKALILPNCIVIITKTIRSLDALSLTPATYIEIMLYIVSVCFVLCYTHAIRISPAHILYKSSEARRSS
jgi:hypothetical protein